MAGPNQKLAKDIEGDTPEQVAWGLLEWIRMVDDVRDRNGILDAYRDGLIAAAEGASLQSPVASAVAANGTQRRHEGAVHGDDDGQRGVGEEGAAAAQAREREARDDK